MQDPGSRGWTNRKTRRGATWMDPNSLKRDSGELQIILHKAENLPVSKFLPLLDAPPNQLIKQRRRKTLEEDNEVDGTDTRHRVGRR